CIEYTEKPRLRHTGHPNSPFYDPQRAPSVFFTHTDCGVTHGDRLPCRLPAQVSSPLDPTSRQDHHSTIWRHPHAFHGTLCACPRLATGGRHHTVPLLDYLAIRLASHAAYRRRKRNTRLDTPWPRARAECRRYS